MGASAKTCFTKGNLLTAAHAQLELASRATPGGKERKTHLTTASDLLGAADKSALSRSTQADLRELAKVGRMEKKIAMRASDGIKQLLKKASKECGA